MTDQLTSYSDYRLFLRDFILFKKKKGHVFSIAKMAERVKVSASFLKMVLAGQRNLSDEQVFRIAAVLNLSFKEKVFFEALVCENQATHEEVKNFHSRRRKTALADIKVQSRTVEKISLEGWYVPSLLLYLIDVEKIGERSFDEINRARIQEVFSLSDAALDGVLRSFEKAEILNIRPDHKVHIRLDNIGTRLKRKDFILKVMDQARKEAVQNFGEPLTFFSADSLSISENEFKNFISDYQELITRYIQKDLSPQQKVKILQVALQSFAVN